MEFTFICAGGETISMESAEYFPYMGFVLRDVIWVDEYVIKVNDDNDVDHIHKVSGLVTGAVRVCQGSDVGFSSCTAPTY